MKCGLKNVCQATFSLNQQFVVLSISLCLNVFDEGYKSSTSIYLLFSAVDWESILPRSGRRRFWRWRRCLTKAGQGRGICHSNDHFSNESSGSYCFPVTTEMEKESIATRITTTEMVINLKLKWRKYFYSHINDQSIDFPIFSFNIIFHFCNT